MAEELVRVTTEAGVATITLNRPDKLNALNQGVADGLLAAVAAIAADPSARAVVLRGEGRSFCVGADLHAVASDTPSARRAWVNRGTELHLALRRLGKPTVARVHGHALGAGCSLMMACDLALAADDAVMGYPEVEHGLVPGVSMIFLQQAVGARTVLDLVLTGRRFSGAEAASLGLINRALPAAELDAAVAQITGRLTAVSPTAVRLSKQLFYDLAGLNPREQLSAGQDLVLIGRNTEDAWEGAAAFKEKRRPQWPGR